MLIKKRVLLSALLFFMCFSFSALAEELLVSTEVAASSNLKPTTQVEPTHSPVRKLQRGFLNVVQSPIEISHELAKEKKNDSFPPSYLIGLGRGAFYAVGRAGIGIYEIVTFAVPFPANYEPVVYPEFASEYLAGESPDSE